MGTPEAPKGAERVPQSTLLQSTPSMDQFTPSFLESLRTVAVKERAALVSSLLNNGVIDTTIGDGAAATAGAGMNEIAQTSTATETEINREAHLAKVNFTAELLRSLRKIVEASGG